MIKGKYQPSNGFRVISRPRRLQSVRSSVVDRYCLVRRVADQYSYERIFFFKNGHRDRVPSVRMVDLSPVKNGFGTHSFGMLEHRRTNMYLSHIAYQNFIQSHWHEPVFVPPALFPEAWKMHFIKRSSFYHSEFNHYSFNGYGHLTLGHLPTRMIANRAQLAAFYTRHRFNSKKYGLRWVPKASRDFTSKRCGRDNWPEHYYIPKKNPDFLPKVKGPYRHKISQR